MVILDIFDWKNSNYEHTMTAQNIQLTNNDMGQKAYMLCLFVDKAAKLSYLP